jgi:hypothetical protein
MGEDKNMYTKEEILNEIRRTAKENGDKPLGEKRFADKTGIGPYDWGQHWARYGDAVVEAGYPRNLPWTKYPEGVLEEKMVSLIRKLGKYPTMNEMRIEQTGNPDFPYPAIKKRQLIFARDLIRYCGKKPDLDDILQYCQTKLEKSGEKEKDDVTDNSSSSVGEVYLYKRGKNYKLGRSKDPVRRGKEIRLESPEGLTLIHSIKTDDPNGVEAYWHKRFENKRWKKTEFFSLNSQDIKAFKRWKKIF